MKVMIVQLLWWWFLLPLCVRAQTSSGEVAETTVVMHGCPEKCGNISVPYPFGLNGADPRCSMNDSFTLKCNNSESKSSPKLMLGDFQILNISVEESTVTVLTTMAYECYNVSWDGFNYLHSLMSLTETPYIFSTTQNRFTAIGCDIEAYMGDSDGTRFGSGCISLCYHKVNLTQEGSCSGFGCCHTQIPNGVFGWGIWEGIWKRKGKKCVKLGESYARNFSSCSYAFLAREGWFEYSTIDLSDLTKVDREAPAILNWAVGEQACESTEPSCGPNTNCVNSDDGPGYRCVCKLGFRGNPYLSGSQGCQDIDECLDEKKYPCKGTCKNTQGDYTCHCPLGMSGDGKVACQGFRVTTLVAVCGMVIFLAFVIIVTWGWCKRRNKHRNFQQNGGSLLKHQKIRIFSEKELEKATEKYDKGRLLGQGGSGAVYKGVLADKSVVAIKKPNEFKHLQREIIIIKEEFQHEISVVSQVNHKNVVKLLGLCLETKFPLLIYEFISNGSLFDHLYVKRSAMLKSWANRLRIAAETSLALDYLHSLADPPIIHRDVKSTNILLDAKFTAKVSDFGASVSIPLGESAVVTKVQGTRGYLDPEYLDTGTLTVKSDVYSFGVVLMELLTGQKPIRPQNSEENGNIIQYFISSVEQKRFSQVLMNFEDVVEAGETEQIEAVAELAMKCLQRYGTERPTMKEVAEQLVGLKKLHEIFHAREDNDDEEMEGLLGHSINTRDEVFHSMSETHYMTALNIGFS